jgi:hypothetical protein
MRCVDALIVARALTRIAHHGRVGYGPRLVETTAAPTSPAPVPDDDRGSTLRRILAVVLVVLSCLALLASVLAVWAKRTVLDTDRFGSIVESVVADPEVTEAVATRVSDNVVRALGDSGRLDEVIPPALQRAEPLLLGALGTFVERVVADLLATEQAQQLLVGAAERAHSRAVQLLQGDGVFGEGLTVEDGTVTLNLVPIVQQALLGLQERGVIPADVDLPQPGDDVEVPEQIARVSAALGVQLPDDFGQVVVYQSESLADAQTTVAQAQRAVALFQRAVVGIVIATLVLIALALLVSTNRMRTLAQLGIGAALVMILAFVIVNRVVDNLPEQVQQQGARAATANILQTATSGLRRFILLLGIMGVAIAIIGYLFGRSRSAAEARARVATSFGRRPSRRRPRVPAGAGRRDPPRLGTELGLVAGGRRGGDRWALRGRRAHTEGGTRRGVTLASISADRPHSAKPTAVSTCQPACGCQTEAGRHSGPSCRPSTCSVAPTARHPAAAIRHARPAGTRMPATVPATSAAPPATAATAFVAVGATASRPPAATVAAIVGGTAVTGSRSRASAVSVAVTATSVPTSATSCTKCDTASPGPWNSRLPTPSAANNAVNVTTSGPTRPRRWRDDCTSHAAAAT